MREYMTNVCLISVSVAFLLHLCMIAYYGSLEIIEPSKYILIAEILLFIGLISFGVSNIINGVRK